MLNVTGEGHDTVGAGRKEDRADLTTKTQAQVCSIALTFCGVDFGSWSIGVPSLQRSLALGQPGITAAESGEVAPLVTVTALRCPAESD